ncbi:thiamine pyrophosphate-binding protein [Enterovirga rhinocerotis]|uniref:Acetolactate synthase-1/2/3 large subunit n=1 Tax=Enterovirga rhinocerotis TaxID=1339210 RepID=A0A4R7C9S9_9HYPH|nr:thiamine pyrophosphate-binding protein [Enterovirga rhinocerotis]TDR94115.1 acetolactate synthase-1/2/3 large subunit [Enterovirga rhinocerotis]
MGLGKPRTGGQILVDALIAQGVERATCVPGESYLAVLDALHDASIDVLVCRNEGGAAMMAEAEGKLTGRPGICFVTRGPGATNASPGIHIAKQDSTPMIVFVGQVDRSMREREAFQEVDYRAVFGTLAKWATEIDQVERIPEIVARAFRVAMQGRPGPVVVALPEDMLTDTAEVTDAPRVEPVEPWPAPSDMDRLETLLGEAQRPLVILGGSRWSDDARAAMVRFAERFDLPVATSFRRAHLFPADHPNYAGEVGINPGPKMTARVKEADLLLLVGARMSEMPSSSYTLLDIPVPKQRVVHVFPDAAELGRVYQPALAIEASPAAFAASLERLRPPGEIAWKQRSAEARSDYLDRIGKARDMPGDFQTSAAMIWLREKLPKDAIVTNGAGNFAVWVHRFIPLDGTRRNLAPTSGSMGYGPPAAIMAKRVHPDRTVVCFAGDGDFMMNGQEFATAVQYDIPAIIVVLDNSMFGTIRMHQERDYPNRISGTRLRNPDFAAYAVAFGGHGETVRTNAEFGPAFERALASGKPAILHCFTDQEALTPDRTMSEIRGG